MAENYVIWFENLRMTDVERVGGKNASLGEMISQLASKGVRVPGGFATTAEAYRAFLAHNGLNERISAALAALNVDDVTELARVGKEIRQWILETPFPEQLNQEIETAVEQIGGRRRHRQNFSCCAFISHGRRFARRFVCRATRNLLEHQWLGKRKRSHAPRFRIFV